MTKVREMRPPMRLTAMLYVYECRNDRCKYYVELNDRWSRGVQVNADGTIPVMQPGPKQFDARVLTSEQQSAVDEQAQAFYDATIAKEEIIRRQ
jgi:hypothetical protein